MKKLKYGDYGNKTDKQLLKKQSQLWDSLRHEVSSSTMDLIDEMCEVERELTLRENQ